MTWRVGLLVLATLTWVPQPSLAQVAPPAPVTSGRAEVQAFRTVFVNSETVYLKSEHLQNALRQQPEFAQWGMQVSLDRIVAADDQRAVLSIPGSDVVAVTHHTAVKGPASAWWNFWSGAAEDPGEALIALPVVLAVGALLELSRTNEHYITIDWREAGRLRELQLQVNSADHQPLLGELKAVTRRGWKSLPEEIHSLRSALQREAANSVPVEFDRSIRLGWTEVPAGSYRFIVLPRSPQRGELYLFPAERADLDRVLAQAVVELAERKATSGTVQVSYKEENGIATLFEIRAGPRSLRFTAVPVNVAE